MLPRKASARLSACRRVSSGQRYMPCMRVKQNIFLPYLLICRRRGAGLLPGRQLLPRDTVLLAPSGCCRCCCSLLPLFATLGPLLPNCLLCISSSCLCCTCLCCTCLCCSGTFACALLCCSCRCALTPACARRAEVVQRLHLHMQPSGKHSPAIRYLHVKDQNSQARTARAWRPAVNKLPHASLSMGTRSAALVAMSHEW